MYMDIEERMPDDENNYEIHGTSLGYKVGYAVVLLAIIAFTVLAIYGLIHMEWRYPVAGVIIVFSSIFVGSLARAVIDGKRRSR